MAVGAGVASFARLVALKVQTVRRGVGELVALAVACDRMAPRGRFALVREAAHLPV